jgi:carbamoyltransferase
MGLRILGISAYYHDSAAALLCDGEIVAAAQEERFTRKKHDASFPTGAVRYCLEQAGCSLNDLDAIVFYEKPFLKFERLLETYYAYAPKGLSSFLRSMPEWMKGKLFLKKMIYRSLGVLEKVDKAKITLLFPPHHLSHAASAYYASPFESAAILSIDGVGERATAAICHGQGKNITVLREMNFPHSVGLLYSAFTYYCGFKVNDGEYKLMGLAPYGNAGSERVRRFAEIIVSRLVSIKEDGSIKLNQEYYTYATGLRMVNDKKWERLFGFPRRNSGDAEAPIGQEHCDLALAIQQVTEEVVLRMAAEARRITGEDRLCMAGGVALNGVANGRLDASGIFRRMFIQPAAGDAGGALGAAYAAHHIYFAKDRVIDPAGTDRMQGAYLGPAYMREQIEAVAVKNKAVYEYIEPESQLLERVARLLAEGKVIGWHQGRMEFGPRALGARSILADPRNPEIQKTLNLKIKFREGFRPFAPVVPVEAVGEYFEHSGTSPYMLLVKAVRKEHCHAFPEGYADWGLSEKLYFIKSSLPAITHVNYSARIQTADRATNPRLWALLYAFKKETGVSVLVNTSFNIRDEPIVNTPEDAYRCFMNTSMDYLVMGNYIFSKLGL